MPFDKDFGWKIINENNYKEFISDNAKSFFIITGKMSNITVIDFDDLDVFDNLINEFPELKNCFTVKTNKGYHLYFKYNDALPNTSKINKLKGIDCRNDGGIIIAPPTKYKLLNGTKAEYKFLGGKIEEIPSYLLELLLPKKEEKKEEKKKEKKQFSNDIKQKEIIKLLILLDRDRSDDYNDWVKVGIIISNELKEIGRNIYHQFSKCSDKYDEDECNKKYDSFDNDKENKLGIGTLKMMAKEDSPE